MSGCNTSQEGKTVALVLQVLVSLPQRVLHPKSHRDTAEDAKTDPAEMGPGRSQRRERRRKMSPPCDYSSQPGLTEHTRTEPHLLHS